MARRECSHLDEWAALLGDDLADDMLQEAPETRLSVASEDDGLDRPVTEDEAN